MGKPLPNLPIDALLPEIVARVTAEPIVLLEAEPGAGKTTRVPPALLRAGLTDVMVLEPRRLAARMAARRVAEELGERVGETAGYQVRFEEVGCPATRLWFVTEGVLTRKLLSRRGIDETRVVILDEFHERHLETDLALALLRRLQTARPELRLLIMSATLGGERLKAQLGCASVLKVAGRVFPVALDHMPASSAAVEDQAATAVGNALHKQSGHVLVFLPGAAEIRRTMAACQPLVRSTGALVLPLHGELSPEEQDKAVGPSERRKVICATNVAESSITIDGVDAVVDSGLARVLTHSQWSGLARLQVEKISKASAIQRAGRAGRTRPGLAIRLYPESDFVRRADEIAPEILRADLTQLALQLAAAGLRWEDLQWLDEPGAAMREQASELLLRLRAFSADGKLTALGRKMSALPLHPRLACFLCWAGQGGASIAAKLSEGRLRLEPERTNYASDVDALLAADSNYAVSRLAKQLGDAVHAGELGSDLHGIEKALLRGFPDRVARRRGEMLLLSNGLTAKLDRASAVRSEFLVALEVDDRSDQTLVRLAADIQPDWLLDAFPERVAAHEEMVWNGEAERVEQVNSLRYDALTVDETRGAPTEAQPAAALLAQKASDSGIARFTEADELNRVVNRVRFAQQHGLAGVPDDFVTRALQQVCAGLSSFNDLRMAARDGAFTAVLESTLPMRLLDEIAPSHVRLPTGRRAKIDYHEDRPPSVASRLQDFFGMKESPTVARGKVPLVVQLLAPNHRPVQVTTDLMSFWKNLYPQVRRELSRRYPRHSWPEDPA